jgi:sugar phosphate isomerase/epimerase
MRAPFSIKITAAALAAAMAPRVLFFKTMWGVFEPPRPGVAGAEGPKGRPFDLASDLDAALARVAAMGYDGVEATVALAMQAPGGLPGWAAALRKAGLRWIAMIFSCGLAPTPGNLGLQSAAGIAHLPDNAAATRDVARHEAVWQGQVREALACARGGALDAGAAAGAPPLLVAITSHTGKDFFSDAEADALLSSCAAFEAAVVAPAGVRVNHETHRGRILYSPWTSPAALARHPALTACADLSHWVVVAEAECGAPELAAAVAAVTPRIRHVHARVGFTEGPQVPDPRGAWCRRFFDGHMKWWGDILAAAADAGLPEITVTPEFGPSEYVPQNAAGEPVANVWEVNHWVGLQVQALARKQFGDDTQGRLVPDVGPELPKV